MHGTSAQNRMNWQPARAEEGARGRMGDPRPSPNARSNIIRNGQRVDTYHKQFLPNYGVFDEDRYFSAGTRAPIYDLGGVLVGVNICEDIWYPGGPPTEQAYAGAEVLLNISSSPFHVGKQGGRERILATRAADTGSIVAYVNLVGGQDELMFDRSRTVFA